MIPTLKAEFTKLLTVRSTYFLVLIALALTAFFTYLGTSPVVYEEAVVSETQNQPADPNATPAEIKPDPETGLLPENVAIVRTVSNDLPKEKLVMNFQDKMPVVTLFIAIGVVLLMAHEFRHNTITYTLTASNSRSKVLLSKILVAITFTLVAMLLSFTVTTAATYAAVYFKDLNLPPQDFDWGYILARLFGYALAFSLIMLAIITLFRNIVAGIVAIFVLPIIDSIAAALLASRDIEPTKLLPFSALNRIGNVANDIVMAGGEASGQVSSNTELVPATVTQGTLVVCMYLIGLWIVAWILFLRRDAN